MATATKPDARGAIAPASAPLRQAQAASTTAVARAEAPAQAQPSSTGATSPTSTGATEPATNSATQNACKTPRAATEPGSELLANRASRTHSDPTRIATP